MTIVNPSRLEKTGGTPCANNATSQGWPGLLTLGRRPLNLAAALFAAKDFDEAKRNAENAIVLEPLLEDAYVLLA